MIAARQSSGLFLVVDSKVDRHESRSIREVIQLAKIQEMGDAALLILYKAIVAELGQSHDVAKKVQAEIERRGLQVPNILH